MRSPNQISLFDEFESISSNNFLTALSAKNIKDGVSFECFDIPMFKKFKIHVQKNMITKFFLGMNESF